MKLLTALAIAAAAVFAAPAFAAAEPGENPAPTYPPAALKAGIEGHVKVEVIADANGNVTDAKIVEATPPGTFDAEALAAAKAHHFRPTGREAKYILTYDFVPH